MALDPREILKRSEPADSLQAAGIAGTRAERIHRLQLGLFGLGMIMLLVGLANVVLTSAQETKATVPTDISGAVSEGTEVPAASDPLADAGVVPDIPTGAETPTTAIVPGDGATKGAANDLPPSRPPE